MKRLGMRTIMGVGGGLVMLAAGFLAYDVVFASPRDDLLTELANLQRSGSQLEEQMADEFKVRAAVRELGQRMLGGSEALVNARLRTAFGDIATSAGLSAVVVTAGRAERLNNPAGRARLSGRVSSDLVRALKSDADALVMQAELKATGKLDQVLRCMQAVRAQPWAHRVESFSISPAGRERERFELSLTVATLFAADLAPRDAAEPARVPVDAGASTAWLSVVEKNVFREPSAKPVVQTAAAPPPTPQAPPPPPPPAPPPYEQWRLTGIVVGRGGPEALLVNTATNERRAVSTGVSVLNAEFVEGAGERAVFRIDAVLFEVRTGQTLADRRPAPIPASPSPPPAG